MTISEAQIEAKIRSIKNLKQYKTFSETEVRKKAVSLLQEFGDELDVEGMFTNRKEKKSARSLTKKYLQYFTPQNISDTNNLKHLIYLEVTQLRLQSLLNESNELGGAVGLKTLEAHNKNLNEIATMKQRLGLVRDKKEKNDALNHWELLQKKAKAWMKANQATRTLVCPKCAGMVLLKIRTDIYDAQEHPFFQDRILGNTHLIKLYKDKTITSKDVAKILGTSIDYIENWLVDKWKKTPTYQEDKESGQA